MAGKMFNKIKTSAGLETNYLQKKAKDDFQHEGDIDQSVKQLKTIRAGMQLRHSLSSSLDKSKDANNSENNLGTQLSAAGGEHSVEHWTQLGRTFVDVTVQKQAMLDVFNKVNEEWKAFESTDIKRVLQLEDQCNRALSDKEYYSKHDQVQFGPADKTYQESGQRLTSAVKDLSQQSSVLFAQWTRRIVEAEAAYHAAVVGVWQQALKDLST